MAKTTTYFVSYACRSGFGNIHLDVHGEWDDTTKEMAHDWLVGEGVVAPTILFFHRIKRAK